MKKGHLREKYSINSTPTKTRQSGEKKVMEGNKHEKTEKQLKN